MQRAAIVTVGTELVEGLRVDTNGPDVSRELSKAGYIVDEMVSVGDDLEQITSTFSRLCATYPLVVSTGGLGPTHDDLTRDGAAAALGLSMSFDPAIRETLDAAAHRYIDGDKTGAAGDKTGAASDKTGAAGDKTGAASDKTGAAGAAAGSKPISEEIYRMALILDGATVLPPVAGMAPGQLVPTPSGELILLPGPPRECIPILTKYLEQFGGHGSEYTDLACFGITESEAQHIVQPMIANYPGIVFTVLASPASTHVILTDVGEGSDVLHDLTDRIATALGTAVYGRGEETLASVVFRLAKEKGLKLATAESCTGGLVGSTIVDIPGSSEVFQGGVISYSNDVKADVLGVSRDDLCTFGAVSSQVAAQMADGARHLLHADIAVSITGIAGPGGGTELKPVGTVWFGVSTDNGTQTVLRTRGGARGLIRLRSANTALDLMRRTMLGLPLDCELPTAF